MTERVEPITQVKPIKFDNNELFERRKGFEDHEHGESFASMFR